MLSRCISHESRLLALRGLTSAPSRRLLLRAPPTRHAQAISFRKMSMKTLSAKNAGALDEELMSEAGGFTLEQLMELAGLSVSQAVYRLQPPNQGNRVLVACGPGNNGGDGLVAARHLWFYGYKPTIFYPKQGKNEHYEKLAVQLRNLRVPFVDDFSAAMKSTDFVVDAIFGFSFAGEVREPFQDVISALRDSRVPVLAVDTPSSWNVADGPPESGPGKDFQPAALISLTAPKPLVKWFKGRHFIGGRFLSDEMAKKYSLDMPAYPGIDQIVEVSSGDQKL